MSYADALIDHVRSVPMRVIGLLVLVWLAALGFLPLLAAPFWAALLSAALGAGLDAIKDLNITGYCLLVALGILLPGSRIGGVQLPFAEMSTFVIALACIGMFILSASPARRLT
jgi:hypothetical protein